MLPGSSTAPDDRPLLVARATHRPVPHAGRGVPHGRAGARLPERTSVAHPVAALKRAGGTPTRNARVAPGMTPKPAVEGSWGRPCSVWAWLCPSNRLGVQRAALGGAGLTNMGKCGQAQTEPRRGTAALGVPHGPPRYSVPGRTAEETCYATAPVRVH